MPIAPNDESERARFSGRFIALNAFGFTLKLERCATQTDLAALVNDYTEQLLKALDRNAVRLLVDRTRELVAR